VRVRVLDDSGKLTIKGASSADGTSRFEWERELPLTEAKRLLDLCLPGMISKQRYIIPVEAHTFEVDVFSGDNQGLIIAEVELSTADEDFPKPEWLGEEVTGDAKYYNSQLAIKPYSKWLDTSFL
jgi:CYTH domain-containing protein